jgi:hypothetical protein
VFTLGVSLIGPIKRAFDLMVFNFMSRCGNLNFERWLDSELASGCFFTVAGRWGKQARYQMSQCWSFCRDARDVIVG